MKSDCSKAIRRSNLDRFEKEAFIFSLEFHIIETVLTHMKKGKEQNLTIQSLSNLRTCYMSGTPNRQDS